MLYKFQSWPLPPSPPSTPSLHHSFASTVWIIFSGVYKTVRMKIRAFLFYDAYNNCFSPPKNNNFLLPLFTILLKMLRRPYPRKWLYFNFIFWSTENANYSNRKFKTWILQAWQVESTKKKSHLDNNVANVRGVGKEG